MKTWLVRTILLSTLGLTAGHAGNALAKDPLKSSIEETAAFIDGSREYTDGWISFYWGKTIEENEQQGDLKGAIVSKWLRYFRSNSPRNSLPMGPIGTSR